MAGTKGTKRGRSLGARERYARPGIEGDDEHWKDKDFNELVSFACEYLADGCAPGQIAERLRKEHQIEVSRERPYHLIAYAALNRLLTYTPPWHEVLSARVHALCPWLRQPPQVVHTAVGEQVAAAAARKLVSIIAEITTSKRDAGKSDVLHIGINGGYSLRLFCLHLANELGQCEMKSLPSRMVVHTMVAGISDDPVADPISFCSYFANNPLLQDRLKFVVLHAPAIVRSKNYAELCKEPGIADALDHKSELDIIVTAISSWSDEHSQVATYLRKRDGACFRKIMERYSTAGDLLARGIGPMGPIPDTEFTVRVLTLIDLKELPAFIAQNGKRVLIIANACPQCNASRADVLLSILKYGIENGAAGQLLTDLVADSRTAQYVAEALSLAR